MSNTIQDAYRIVYNDILNKNNGVLVGNYDAKNSTDHYMYGVGTVMELIAYGVGEETGDSFSSMFYQNMAKSEEKAGV